MFVLCSLVFTDGQSHAGDNTDDAHTGTDDHMVAADNIGSRDLATLVTLNEDSILEQLSLRYSRDVIYTNVGDILIAVSPLIVLFFNFGRTTTSKISDHIFFA